MRKARRRLLASADPVDASRLPECAHWVISGQADLRGRSRPTRLAHPVADR
ncbi:MAG: hypothetical protein ACR2MB_03645 [Acidimicrobiales bacterium]